MSVDAERSRLEREAEALVTLEDPEVEQRLIDVYERCGPPLGKRCGGCLGGGLLSSVKSAGMPPQQAGLHDVM
jgi:hypothetical protein